MEQKDLDLAHLRRELEEVDRSLVHLLRQRLHLVASIARYKAGALATLRDPQREKEVLAKVEELARQEGVDPWACRQIFREVLAMSVRYQEQLLLEAPAGQGANLHRCAFQGSPWAYSHLAALKFFGAKARHMEFVGLPSFAACVSAVERGEVGWALLPIENTTAGSINETYDLLRHTFLSIVGEEILPVEHCLLGLPGTCLTEVRRVLSHPQALAQCRGFLASLPVVAEAYVDTAEAAQEVSRRADRSLAAIASKEAGEAFGLQVLASNIADQEENWTRFVVVAAHRLLPPPQVKAKTSLVLTTPHRRGALAHCLQVLAQAGVNLTKLESRPLPNRPWEYMFYLDLEGSLAESHVAEALAELESLCPFFKLLGCYPARTGSARPLDSGDSPR